MRDGTVARVLKVIRLSSGNYSVVLQGVGRMRILEPMARTPCLRAKIVRLHEPPMRNVEIDALAEHLREAARRLAALMPNQPREASAVLENVREPGVLADLIASNLSIGTEAKQSVLEILDVRERLRRVMSLVSRQADVLRVKKEIRRWFGRSGARAKQPPSEAVEGASTRARRNRGRRRRARGSRASRAAELPPEADKAARRQLAPYVDVGRRLSIRSREPMCSGSRDPWSK